MTDSQSVSQSVCLDVEPLLDLMTRCLLLLIVTVVSLWGALSDNYQSESAFLSRLSVYIYIKVFTFQTFNIQVCVHTLYLRPLSVRAQYSNLCPCPILCTFSFLWLWMISACLLHNFVL
jgi:hypothetical protein